MTSSTGPLTTDQIQLGVIMKNVRRLQQAERLITNAIRDNDVLECDLRFTLDKLKSAKDRILRQANRLIQEKR